MKKGISMRNIYSIIILLFTSSLLAQQNINEEDVKNSVEEFGEAFLRADISILSDLLCENYIHVNGSSGNVINKTNWLNWIESRRTLLDKSELVVNSYIIEDVQIKLFEETAVVTGIVKSDGLRKDLPFKSHLRFTNVWIIEDGKLCRASFHDSTIPEI